MPVNTAITIRKGTGSQWSSTNPILASGEPGYDLSNNILKIGDGVSNWNSLKNVASSSGLISPASGQFQNLSIYAPSYYEGGIEINPAINSNGIHRIYFNGNNVSGSIEASEGDEVLNFSGPWLLNNIPISVSGHTHTSSNITNFNSSVSGLFPANLTTGIGISGYVSRWNGSNSLTSGVIFDNDTSVGIGTTNPSGALHIERIVANNSYVLLSNPSNVVKTHIGVGNNDSVPFLASTNNIQLSSGNNGWGFFDRATDGNLRLARRAGSTSWSDVLHINRNNGHMGIGTTSPSSQLHVIGTGIFSSGIAVNRVAPSSVLDINGESRIQGILYFNQNDTDYADTSRNRCSIQRAGAQNLTLAGGSNSLQLQGDGGKLVLSSSSVGVEIGSAFANAYVMFNPGGSEKARITPSGSFGIGTSTPSGQLHVLGTGIVSSRIGIGTNNPTFDLDVRTDSVNAFYVSQGSGTRFLSFGSTGFINNTTLAVSKTTWNGLASLEVSTVIPSRRGIYISQVASQTANAIETRNADGSIMFSNINASGGAYFAGAVGINTLTPSGLLHIFGDSYSQGSLYISRSGTAVPLTYNRLYNDTSDSLIVRGGDNTINLEGQAGRIRVLAFSQEVEIGNSYNAGTANQHIRFSPAATERMRLTSVGNLGVGTTAPSGRLHVVGTGLFASTTGLVPNALLDVYSTTSGELVFNVEGTNGSLFSVVDSLSGSLMSVNNNAGLPIFEVFSDDSIIGGRFNQNDFVISSGGNIGIGTGVPSTKFHVVGNSTFNGDVSCTGSFIAGSGTSSLPSFEFINDPDTGLFSPSANTLSISTSGTERLRIDNIGNVGIGKNNPAVKLDVVGDVAVSGAFSATTKSFKISHPSKPGYVLEYGSLESPYHGVRLTGKDTVVNGVCVVNLPDYIKDLVLDDDSINIQITNYKHNKILYIQDIKIPHNTFTVGCDTNGLYDFFWTFTGLRKDIPQIVTEYSL